MKYIIILCITMTLGLSVYIFSNDDKPLDEGLDTSKPSQVIQNPLEVEQRANKTTLNVDEVATKPDYKPTNFNSLIAEYDFPTKEKYTLFNQLLFGALEFSTEREFKSLKNNGFPSIEDVKYVLQNNPDYMSQKLFSELENHPILDSSADLNFDAVASLNLLEAIVNLERTIRFFIPSYTRGQPFPRGEDWPEGKRPQQVKEAAKLLILAQASVRNESGIGLLARARFDELNFYGQSEESLIKLVFDKVSDAQIKLEINSLDKYIIEHYPKYNNLYEEMVKEKAEL
ncbi:hypothetical protein [Alteromonas sp. W364]|nr:hypothetical protein [Alteromonas sp. W364]MDT0628191.1 hypothetical protein [Alteromonas sp. W364]